MSNKDDDGPLDGLLSPEGKWISETGPLHELIKSNLEHTYQPFWFPSLMSNILWKKIPNTNPQRHNMHNKPTTTHKRDLAISNLGLLINTLEQLLDILNSNSTTQTQKNIAQMTRNLTKNSTFHYHRTLKHSYTPYKQIQTKQLPPKTKNG